MKIKKIVPILIFSVFCLSSFAYALNVDTHQAINQYVVEQPQKNGFSLDSYLQYNLKIGIGTTFKGNNATFLSSYLGYGTSFTVEEWIKNGGTFEDKPPQLIFPYQRSLNHFNNPLGYAENPYGFITKGLSDSRLATDYNYLIGNGY